MFGSNVRTLSSDLMFLGTQAIEAPGIFISNHPTVENFIVMNSVNCLVIVLYGNYTSMSAYMQHAFYCPYFRSATKTSVLSPYH